VAEAVRKDQRLLLEGVGHFPHREAPRRVSEAIIGLLMR
jgi:pimeloyl-ACP methyl ester carboxylesterase